MRFTGLTIWTTLFAAGATIGLVALLHLLRTQAERIPVVTTLFWQDLKAATQARTLLHRMRNWPSFLLIATTAALLVFSLHEDVIRRDDARDVVLVIDAGTSMRAVHEGKSRIEEARTAARRIASNLTDSDRLCMILCGPLPRVIQRFEEPVASFEAHLREVRAGDGPAQSETAIRIGRSLVSGRAGSLICWISDREKVGDDTAGVLRIPVGGPAENAAVLGAVFVPQEDPAQGRLHVRVGWWGRDAGQIPVRVLSEESGDTLLHTTASVSPGKASTLVSELIAADGRKFRIIIDLPDAVGGDNRLEYVLPRRPPLVIGADPQIPGALKTALLAAPARLTQSADPACTVLVTRNPGPATLPCIRIVGDGPAVSARTPARVDGTAQNSWFCGTGASVLLPEEGWTQVLATAGETPVIVSWRPPGGRPQLLIGDCVLSPGSTAVTQPWFATLIRRTAQEMGGWTEQPTGLSVRQTTEDPLLRDSAEAPSRLTLSPDRLSSNTWDVAAPADPVPVSPSGLRIGLQQLLLLAALTGLLADAFLHARGRIV